MFLALRRRVTGRVRGLEVGAGRCQRGADRREAPKLRGLTAAPVVVYDGAAVEGRREVCDCVVSAAEAGEPCRTICQVFARDRRSRLSRFPDFAEEVELLHAYSSAYATMVIIAETEDMPRRVWVKMYTVEAHARTPPKGSNIFTWKEHAKKHRKASG